MTFQSRAVDAALPSTWELVVCSCLEAALTKKKEQPLPPEQLYTERAPGVI